MGKKIEIDLDDILGDEDGVETMRESIQRQVVDSISLMIKSGITKKIDFEISEAIQEMIVKDVKPRAGEILDDILNTPYTPTDNWGGAEGVDDIPRRDRESGEG